MQSSAGPADAGRRPMNAPSFTRILVGWDGSPGAADSLAAACRLAGGTGEVLALAVVPSYAHVEAAEEREEAVAESRVPLARRYEQVVATVPPAQGRRVSLKFLEGEQVAEVLLTYSLEHGYDLLVVGLHGNEGEIHHKVGHVTSHVVKAGCCPVLLMPTESVPRPREPSRTGVRRLLRPFSNRAST
jgi:nucleotide-binding universal stress UspA family protein